MAGLSRHHHGCGSVHPYSVYTLKCVVLLFLPSWLGGDCCRRAGVAHGITPPLDLDYGLCGCFKGLPDSFTEALYRLSFHLPPLAESTACVGMQGRLGRVDFRRRRWPFMLSVRVSVWVRVSLPFFPGLDAVRVWAACGTGIRRRMPVAYSL